MLLVRLSLRIINGTILGWKGLKLHLQCRIGQKRMATFPLLKARKSAEQSFLRCPLKNETYKVIIKLVHISSISENKETNEDFT